MSDPQRAWLRQTIVGILMLPLSVLPFVLYFGRTQEGSILWAKVETNVAPPGVSPPPPEDLAWMRAHRPSYEGTFATLVYHGLGSGSAEGEGRFTISPERFAEQLVALRVSGFNDVTATDVALAYAGIRPLPPNAVMITFDDGRTDAMLYADPILDRVGMRATMFAIGSAASEPGVYYASWDELRDYAATGRWDIQSHTADAHVEQSVGEDETLPRLTSLAPGESIEDYAARVREDLRSAAEAIERETGSVPLALAYPFGAYGADDRTNDPRVRAVLRAAVRSEHLLSFNQDDQDGWGLSSCGDDPHALRRLEVGDWSGRALVGRITRAADAGAEAPDCTDRHVSGSGARVRAALAPAVRERLADAARHVDDARHTEGSAARVARRLPARMAAAGDGISGCQSSGAGCLLPEEGGIGAVLRAPFGIFVGMASVADTSMTVDGATAGRGDDGRSSDPLSHQPTATPKASTPSSQPPSPSDGPTATTPPSGGGSGNPSGGGGSGGPSGGGSGQSPGGGGAQHPGSGSDDGSGEPKGNGGGHGQPADKGHGGGPSGDGTGKGKPSGKTNGKPKGKAKGDGKSKGEG